MSYSTTLGITVPDATDNFPSSIITLQSGFNTIDTLIGARVKKGGGDTIQASGVGVVPLILKGASGQTAHIQDWQDSNGIALAAVEANGLLRLSNLVNPNVTSYLNNPAAVGVTSNNLASPKADNVALAITGFTAQTANLQEWRNSSGTILSRIDSNGAPRGTDDSLLLSTIAGNAAYVLVSDALSRQATLTIPAVSNITSGTAAGLVGIGGTDFVGKSTRISVVASVVLTDTAAAAYATAHADISTDGGTTWTNGPNVNVQTDSSRGRSPVTAAFTLSATPTAQIQCRVVVVRSVGTQLNVDSGVLTGLAITP